jgi:hypothetical protein
MRLRYIEREREKEKERDMKKVACMPTCIHTWVQRSCTQDALERSLTFRGKELVCEASEESSTRVQTQSRHDHIAWGPQDKRFTLNPEGKHKVEVNLKTRKWLQTYDYQLRCLVLDWGVWYWIGVSGTVLGCLCNPHRHLWSGIAHDIKQNATSGCLGLSCVSQHWVSIDSNYNKKVVTPLSTRDFSCYNIWIKRVKYIPEDPKIT